MMMEVTQYELTVLKEPNGELPLTYLVRQPNEEHFSTPLTGDGLIQEMESRHNLQPAEAIQSVAAPVDIMEFIEFSYQKSNEFRYLMADRLSAAMTKSSLASSQIPQSFPGKVKGWLDDSIQDLEKASSILNEWILVYEGFAPSNLIGKQ